MGAALGACAAIGGLVFTAVATYYSAAVSRAQLQQSREDAQREHRSQAMRVSFWTEDPVANDMRLHIMNRSPDPVTGMFAGFYVQKGDRGYESDEEPGRYGRLYAELPNMPPCSETIIMSESLRWHVPDGTATRELPVDARVFILWMGFVDRDSNEWLRRDGELLPSWENPPSGVGTLEWEHGGHLVLDVNGEVEGKLPTTRAASCEDR